MIWFPFHRLLPSRHFPLILSPCPLFSHRSFVTFAYCSPSRSMHVPFSPITPVSLQAPKRPVWRVSRGKEGTRCLLTSAAACRDPRRKRFGVIYVPVRQRRSHFSSHSLLSSLHALLPLLLGPRSSPPFLLPRSCTQTTYLRLRFPVLFCFVGNAVHTP